MTNISASELVHNTTLAEDVYIASHITWKHHTLASVRGMSSHFFASAKWVYYAECHACGKIFLILAVSGIVTV